MRDRDVVEVRVGVTLAVLVAETVWVGVDVLLGVGVVERDTDGVPDLVSL